MKLPEPKTDGGFSVEKAISLRRSIRGYAETALSLEDISQLLWASQGKTDSDGARSAPSAGATFPLQTYLVAGKVEGLTAGIYRYDGQAHELTLLFNGDERQKLSAASRGQSFVGEAPASLIISCVTERTERRYQEKGHTYTCMEVGHAAQNVYLQATARELGTVAVGAFDEGAVSRLLWLLPGETAMYIMPVGKPAQGDKIARTDESDHP